ncbi:DUF7677 family protein [Mucilaginibacter auburnensis]
MASGSHSAESNKCKYAEKVTDYLRAYCDPSFTVEPPFEDWEVALHRPPALADQA